MWLVAFVVMSDVPLQLSSPVCGAAFFGICSPGLGIGPRREGSVGMGGRLLSVGEGGWVYAEAVGDGLASLLVGLIFFFPCSAGGGWVGGVGWGGWVVWGGGFCWGGGCGGGGVSSVDFAVLVFFFFFFFFFGFFFVGCGWGWVWGGLVGGFLCCFWFGFHPFFVFAIPPFVPEYRDMVIPERILPSPGHFFF